MRKFRLPAALCPALLALAACGGSGSDTDIPAGPVAKSVSIPFKAVAGVTEINCDAGLAGLGLSGVNASLRSFAFYVHDVRLVTDAGVELPVTLTPSDWQYENLALLDFQDKDSECSGAAKPVNKLVTGTYEISAGQTVAALRFTIGVPADLNHEDPAAAPSPLNRVDLQWNWQAGHKYMRLDVAPDGGVFLADSSTTEKWLFHLGSTGCTGDPAASETVNCSAPNRPEIELAGFNPATSAVQIDYAKLVESTTVNQNLMGPPGCMSGATDTDCAEAFDKLGLPLGESADPHPGQTVFSLVNAN